MIDKISAYFRPRSVPEESPALTPQMKVFLRYVASKVVVHIRHAYEACGLHWQQGDVLTNAAHHSGYIVSAYLLTTRSGSEDRASCMTLTDLGYARLGMTPPRRMTEMQAEYVRRRLHRFIPNSELEPNIEYSMQPDLPVRFPDLLVRFDSAVHQRLLDALRAQAPRKSDRLYAIPDGASIAIECEIKAYSHILQISDDLLNHAVFAVTPGLFQQVITGTVAPRTFVVDAIRLLDDLRGT